MKATIQAHHGDFNYLDGYGSMVFDAGATPGTSSAQTVLTSGTYIALDLNGAHSGPTPFVVTASTAPATLPTFRLDRVQLSHARRRSTRASS